MICRIRIQTQTVVSYYNCTAPDSQCSKSVIRAFEIENDRKRKNLNEGNGSYQWSDASDSVGGQVKIGHNEMSVPLTGIEPPSSKTL